MYIIHYAHIHNKWFQLKQQFDINQRTFFWNGPAKSLHSLLNIMYADEVVTIYDYGK